MKVFRDLFRRMGINALWYVGVFALVMVVLQIIFKATGVDVDVTLLVISELSTWIYMLVIGIVWPLVYFTYYLAVGVTRKQFTLGLFAAAAVLSLCFAALRIPLLLVRGEFSALAVLVPALNGALAFLVGWTAAVGFQYMRLVPILAGTVCATGLFHGLILLERLGLPPWSDVPIALAALLAVGAALFKAVGNIPVRC
jgi:hypothetical protein